MRARFVNYLNRQVFIMEAPLRTIDITRTGSRYVNVEGETVIEKVSFVEKMTKEGVETQ